MSKVSNLFLHIIKLCRENLEDEKYLLIEKTLDRLDRRELTEEELDRIKEEDNWE